MSLDLQEVLDFAISLSKQAGEAIVQGSETRFKNATGFDEKKNTADLVTETDQNTEKLVCEAIKDKYPDHKYVGCVPHPTPMYWLTCADLSARKHGQPASIRH